MDKYNFTQVQIERIHDLLEVLNAMNNNPMSSQKMSGIAMYTDREGNFVCSYVLRTFGSGDGAEFDIKYVMITPSGEKVNMLLLYKSEIEAVNKIEKMERIRL